MDHSGFVNSLDIYFQWSEWNITDQKGPVLGGGVDLTYLRKLELVEIVLCSEEIWDNLMAASVHTTKLLHISGKPVQSRAFVIYQ